MNPLEIIQKTGDLISRYLQVKKALSDNFSIQDAEIWLKRFKKQVVICNKLMNHGKLAIANARKLHTYLGHIKTFQKLLKVNHIGMGLEIARTINNRVVWEEITSCFKSRIRTSVIINLSHKDLKQFFQDAVILFKSKIKNILKKFPMIKVNSTFCGEFIKHSADTDVVDFKYFNTRNANIDVSTDLHKWFLEHVEDRLFNKLSEFQERDSGFALQSIISLEININKLEMGNGTSYIKLPEQILRKHACINVQNDDQACFYWSIVSALYPSDKNQQRTSSYPHYSVVLNTESLESPMSLQKIPKFEKINNISINVYSLELNKKNDKQFYNVVPARLTKKKSDRHVNLLLVQNIYFPKLDDYEAVPVEDTDSTTEVKYHYCWIKDLSRLVSTQLTKGKAKKYICDRCLNYFNNEAALTSHSVYCENINDCKISFPKYDFMEFKDHVYKQRNPFVIYADFESLLTPCRDKFKNIKTKTQRYQHHKAYSAGYYLKCSYDDSLSYFKSYRGDDCLDWFALEMSNIATFVESKIKTIVPMEKLQTQLPQMACHICEKLFKPGDKIVHDHDHFTGDFRGFAHKACNLNFRKLFVVPIILHNFSGYDSHFIIRNISKRGRVSLLPINKERYISFTQYDSQTSIKFRFIDSFRFLGASLDELVSTMNVEDMTNLKKQFANLNDDHFKLLTRKGVFCYDYVDCVEKLDLKSLPPFACFYNKLNDENISEDDYAHAISIWNNFNIQSLGEYSDLYLKTDILLLADVFENFREKCYNTYKLDVAWYYTMPGYSWSCCLRYTQCKLELVKSIDQLMFIEKGIRGGISGCSNRFSEANNKYMPNYDPSKPSNYLLYVDANNLYGKSMCEPLPYGGFEWVENFENFDVLAVADDSTEGYILQVDLEYPETLHDSHKDFPFCAEHYVPPKSKLPKLTATLRNKYDYILHYRNLKQAIANGLVLKKIHKILKFKQSPWLKPYIELNSRLRAAASTTFEKNLYKLFNNAIFGKTMQNIRKHRVVKLVSSYYGRYGAKNLIASPSFHNRTIFDENLMAIEMKQTELIFNKPLYVGMCILDISKTVMYDFQYDYMLKKFQNNECKLMYYDTDSFFYQITCDDVYQEVIKQDIERFDTSDYPVDNVYNIPLVNKKVPGLMKDEANGQIISHFVGLRSKMYAYKVLNGKVVKKSKGIKYKVVKNKITFEDYVNCLKEYKEKSTTQRSIISYAHEVFSVEQSKIALSPFDDKRYLLPNSYDTLPWGHRDIKVH
ncbi:unnamed protein product [Callosobruchus maculatus]|uniref:DNA-directed DNA polymerase n=1 Tax=Callosobruchus maculatus TaxID=64391 RepID=A0A653D134_CALMS|nr:unnamed protein product [Callosobruchus maculatus]VEN57497.1 unnamed protein product [Callosobruchus maculatus]